MMPIRSGSRSNVGLKLGSGDDLGSSFEHCLVGF